MFTEFFQKLRKVFSAFFKNRVAVLGVVLLVLFVLLIVRLFQLQIVRGDEYYENYVNTTRKEVSIPAIRGNIYDRNGRLLAGNKVVYNVTLTDGNYYTKSNGAFNEMILSLVGLLEKYNADIVHVIPVVMDEDGHYAYSGSDARIRTLIRDVYGQKAIAELKEKGEDPYTYPADKVMAQLRSIYNFGTRWARAAEISDEDALKICNIRYALAATAYTRYISTTISTDVTPEVQAAVLESQLKLRGVNVEESMERVYYNSECFSSILGYVGSITSEEIDELNALGGDYIAGDVIGKEGIESAYESYLQGTKGRKTIYVNSTGIILHEEVTEEPEQGKDIYLSIDADITVAAYNVIEQQLAGIIVNHLYAGTDYDPMVAYEKSEYLTPIRDVYFQMINNHILSSEAFAEDGASEAEKSMYRKMIRRKQEVTEELKDYLEKRSVQPLSSMDSYQRAYINSMYSHLLSVGYLKRSEISEQDEMVQAFRAGESSFPQFLIYALKNGFADLSVIDEESRYHTVDECYDFVTGYLIDTVSREFSALDSLVYDELIHTDVIGGCEVGLALFSQGVLKDDPEAKKLLENGDQDTAFDFFEAKITSMELTPGEIALDPCSAGLVLTDPNTGRLLSVVSYPGFDSNRINDYAYYSRLLTDQSSPLYSRATQTRLAPGSTFKMITSTAALQDGYLGQNEKIVCEGIFDKLDHPRCWIYRLNDGAHGALDIVHAIGQSCNCFFYELGYRFSTNENGLYSAQVGISKLNEYASIYGFGEPTGIETNENVSELTTELPVTSAIGQGTYAFTTISLARYVTAIASNGNVYEFRLLDRVEDNTKKTIERYRPEVLRSLDFPDSTWDILHEGMYTVVHEGGSRNGDFASLRFDYAAKSGSAQENRMRAEHGWYVTYGPYDDVKYAMAVQIPNGYSAGNAALIARGLYEFLEGDITLEEILMNSASKGSINDILD
ncbi:MAG: hypothetical protein IJM76_09075 [Lachnospiraceae bacterium]|nr:hypothetical protein [Lachnospiraceae bacterium]